MATKLAGDYFSDFQNVFALEPGKTALIPVDLQYGSACRSTGLGKLLNDGGKNGLGSYRFDRIENVVVPNVQKLLAFFRKHQLRVIYLTLGSLMPDYSDIPAHRRAFMKAKNVRRGEKEYEILDEVKPWPGEMVINKTTPSAFNSSEIDSTLRAMDIRYCLFAGVSTHMCVEGTARDASDRGYNSVLVEDACGANKPEFHDNALLVFQRGYGRVSTTDEVIRELERKL